MSPIDGKVRIVDTAELAKIGASANYQRAKRLIPLAQHLLRGLDASGGQEWMGHRPSTPDSYPVLGCLARNPNVYFAFGHNHSGLKLGGMTGRLMADLVAGRPASIQLAPFDPARFQG